MVQYQNEWTAITGCCEKCGLSLRHIVEMMAERGVFVDHATVHRWALKIVPTLVKVFRGRKRPVGKSWRMDETYIKVRGQ